MGSDVPGPGPDFEPGPAELRIDLDAIAANWRLLQARAGKARCAAVVKADAYGLSAARVAPALWAAGCRSFFVAHGAEGLSLRQCLPNAEIFVLHGLSDQLAAFAAAGLVPVLNSLDEIAAWSARAGAAGRPLPAALHIDTGMTRLGLSEASVARLAAEPERLANLSLRLVMSHLACADDPAHPMNREQLDAFARLKRALPPLPASLSSSGGIFQGAPFHFEMVRPGIALYGGRPLASAPNPMAEAVRLAAKVLQVHDVDTPRTVGYGATRQVSGGTRIATIGVGYADGYFRSLGNRGFACIDGIPVPVVGRVSMDLITLDVTALPATRVGAGTRVDLIGGGVDVDALADAAGTLAYEILTRLGPRYRRVYVGAAAGEGQDPAPCAGAVSSG